MAYLAATEPRAEKDAKRTERDMKPAKENPHLAALADAEVERDASRRQTETLRELLARAREQAGEHFSPDLLDAIAKALR